MKEEIFKATISCSEIKNIDQLILKGLYKSLPDFINTAVCNELKAQSSHFDPELSKHLSGFNAIEIIKNTNELDLNFGLDLNFELDLNFSLTDLKGSGIFSINSKDLERTLKLGKKLTIKVVGILIINKNVSPKLAEDTLKNVKVYGFIFASAEVKRIIDSL